MYPPLKPYSGFRTIFSHTGQNYNSAGCSAQLNLIFLWGFCGFSTFPSLKAFPLWSPCTVSMTRVDNGAEEIQEIKQEQFYSLAQLNFTSEAELSPQCYLKIFSLIFFFLLCFLRIFFPIITTAHPAELFPDIQHLLPQPPFSFPLSVKNLSLS